MYVCMYMYVCMLGAKYRFVQTVDCAAQSVVVHFAQVTLECSSACAIPGIRK